MKKIFYFLLTFLFLTSILFAFGNNPKTTFASSCAATDYDCQLAEIQRELDALTPAHEANKKELENLKSQLASLDKRITSISTQLNILSADIIQREEDLAFAKEIFEEKASNHYKFIRFYDPIAPFLFSEDASEAFRKLNFRQKAADEDRKTMEIYAEDLLKLKNDKESLEKNKTSLASVRKQVDDRAEFLGGEVEKVESYLATLSSKQQSILAAKSGAFIASVGDSDLADDYYASIKGFNEAAPSGSFSVFSFGAYTHRKGMSQYGARGRANNGQNYNDILNVYYGKTSVDKDTSGTISVEGYGNLEFETTYLYGIAEMPSTWHPEALKAQAVAARTYAYRYKQEGKTICTSQSCQVFLKSKSDNPPAAWKQAVDDTRGKILEDVVTYYSSTSGGYLSTMGWDTTDGGGGSNFLDKTYEKIGGSPWVYKAWYTEGYSPSSAKCGRSNPWLTGVELADIVNAALVLKNKGGDDRVTPVTTSCWGGNPYSHDELRSVASSYGGISSVSSVYVTQGNGSTNSVVINGSITLGGDEFKQAFNLRAPGYLMIPQKGFAFFNIESK
jgi:peptidoglycan hydrolase CwlO-like protein